MSAQSPMTPRWLVTGSGGKLGSVLLRRLRRAGQTALGTVSSTGPRPFEGETRSLDLLDAELTDDLVHLFRPTVIVHAAAVSSPASARAEPGRAQAVNVALTARLTRLAGRIGARLLYISTDMVFDGWNAPYSEASSPNPSTEYGRTKLAGEREASRWADALILRLPLLYGSPASSRISYFDRLVEDLRTGRPTTLFTDEYRTPLWLEDAAAAIELAALHAPPGVMHVGGPERLSRLDMGRCIARALELRADRIVAGSRMQASDKEPRPRDLSLNSARFQRQLGVAPGRPMSEALQLALGNAD